MTPPEYLRHKASLIRARANDPRKSIADAARDCMIETARQLEIAADELAAGFHESE